MAKQLQLFCGEKSSSWHIISVVIYVAMQVGPLSTKLLSKVPLVHHDQRQRLSSLVSNRLNRLTFDAEFFSPSFVKEGYLTASQAALCKFPHDTIYSIHGLCSPLDSTMMHPNYSQPVQKVHSQVVKYFAEGIGSLDLLVYSQYSDSMSDLPSWTPDWRQPPRMLPFNLIVSDSISEWHCAALKRFRPIFTEDLLLMKVSGIRYGAIIGTKLEVEFIPGIRIEEWSEYEDENGVSTSVALR
jgi:hypothetical protein